MIKKVLIKDAVGMTLAHDVTKIIPGKYKGVLFKRGHVIKEEDIPDLLDVGEGHIYALKLSKNEVHEEEAALRIAGAVSGSGLELMKPREGRVNIKTGLGGLLKINVDLLEKINSIDEVILATLHNHTICSPGQTVAGTRIIPLFTGDEKIREVEDLCRGSGTVLEILPFKKKKIGVIITGNEVFEGRIKDKFGGIIQKKVEALGSAINRQKVLPDDVDLIAGAIGELISQSCDLIIVCGGLSVDPDDVTFEGVMKSGAKIVSYGLPILPGAMLLYALLKEIPILGAPACVLYNKTTAFDLVLPLILADEQIRKRDLLTIGHGGLCLHCSECLFPACPFGK